MSHCREDRVLGHCCRRISLADKGAACAKIAFRPCWSLRGRIDPAISGNASSRLNRSGQLVGVPTFKLSSWRQKKLNLILARAGKQRVSRACRVTWNRLSHESAVISPENAVKCEHALVRPHRRALMLCAAVVPRIILALATLPPPRALRVPGRDEQRVMISALQEDKLGMCLCSASIAISCE